MSIGTAWKVYSPDTPLLVTYYDKSGNEIGSERLKAGFAQVIQPLANAERMQVTQEKVKP